MVLTVGFDSSFAALGSAAEKRPLEREQDSSRIIPTAELDAPSPDNRRRLESPEGAPPPTRLAFTAKFGPDSDGFPLQLVSGDALRGAESYDPEVIVENRISRDSQTALLQAQETRDAVADDTRRKDIADASRRIDTDAPEAPEPDDSRADPGSVFDLQV